MPDIPDGVTELRQLMLTIYRQWLDICRSTLATASRKAPAQELTMHYQPHLQKDEGSA
jgi:hypothetical protein